jgi:osmotically-inducible protein OsmY
MPSREVQNRTAAAEPEDEGVLSALALELGLKRPGPKNYRRADARIRDDVCERLWHESHLDVSEVSVSVEDGIVRLDGTVPHRYMKHRIEDLAAACAGVSDVENRIRVAPVDATPRGAGTI